MVRKIKYPLIITSLFFILCVFMVGCSVKNNNINKIFIGDEPSIKNHLKQQDIEQWDHNSDYHRHR